MKERKKKMERVRRKERGKEAGRQTFFQMMHDREIAWHEFTKPVLRVQNKVNPELNVNGYSF